MLMSDEENKYVCGLLQLERKKWMVHTSISMLPSYFMTKNEDLVSRQGIDHCANFLKISERACSLDVKAHYTGHIIP